MIMGIKSNVVPLRRTRQVKGESSNRNCQKLRSVEDTVAGSEETKPTQQVYGVVKEIEEEGKVNVMVRANSKLFFSLEDGAGGVFIVESDTIEKIVGSKVIVYYNENDRLANGNMPIKRLDQYGPDGKTKQIYP